MQQITPFLWFDDQAEQAATLYVELFPDSKLLSVDRKGDGKVMSVTFRIGAQTLMALNGGPHYALTPAFSLFVPCDTQAEIDAVWDRLADGGKPLRCGWITDRYGLTWQIVPARISELIKHPAAMQAMMGMVKLDLAQLEAAARG